MPREPFKRDTPAERKPAKHVRKYWWIYLLLALLAYC